MQRKLEKRRRSDEEIIKDAGFILDFDEMARERAKREKCA